MTVAIDTKIDRIKLKIFLEIANRLPKIDASAGSCTIPTVTQAAIKAVTAKRLTWFFNSSPPIT